MNLLELLQQPAAIRFFGLAGACAAALGALIAALPYRGRQGEGYSILNHFISELGEVGVSRHAWAFNWGLILCGLLLLPCSIGLGLLIPGWWARLGLAAGVVTSLAVAAVGLFPMNNLDPHVKAAMTYFRMGLVMVLFFTIAIAAQPNPPVLPRSMAMTGVPAILAYAFFLVYMRVTYRPGQDALGPIMNNRPRFWTLPFAEWMIFWTTVPWLFALALGL